MRAPGENTNPPPSGQGGPKSIAHEGNVIDFGSWLLWSRPKVPNATPLHPPPQCRSAKRVNFLKKVSISLCKSGNLHPYLQPPMCHSSQQEPETWPEPPINRGGLVFWDLKSIGGSLLFRELWPAMGAGVIVYR